MRRHRTISAGVRKPVYKHKYRPIPVVPEPEEIITPGYVIPADNAKAPYATTLAALQKTSPPRETDADALMIRRRSQHAKTDWGCTFATDLDPDNTMPMSGSFFLVVDDFARHDVQLPENSRATHICNLRSGNSGGYPVKGDAFLYQTGEPNTLDAAFIDVLIKRGQEKRYK